MKSKGIKKDLYLRAIREFINDARFDPFVVLHEIFGEKFNNNGLVKYNHIEEFLRPYDSIFQEGDLDKFLKELKNIKRNMNLIDIKELSSLIKNDIEGLPK